MHCGMEKRAGKWLEFINNKPEQVISFSRESEGDKVIVAINFSNKPAKTTFQSKYHAGKYKELFTNNSYAWKGDDELELGPWKYVVLVKDK